jgi:hypothetical protein
LPEDDTPREAEIRKRLLAIIGERGAWLSLAGRITTAAVLNEAMKTSRYDYDSVADVPLDVIHLAAAMLARD